MFGESESESPRVPSPWDSLSPASRSPPTSNETQRIPKLVPEAEGGNIEYKLQLLSPTPARFARLVTQLKWRLLEGGGQAYYELGVADSGSLVGLPRQQLEESLETLEMMAGEIGASVIVVKEVEVPPELSSIAESQLEKWDGRRSARRKDLLRMQKQDTSPTTSPTELETEFFITDITDTEESSCHSPTTPPTSPRRDTSPIQFAPSTCPPFDPALAIFTMDEVEDIADYADNEAADDDIQVDFSVNLEISAVYKPRPMNKRATPVTSPSTHPRHTKKKHKNGYPQSKSAGTTTHTKGSTSPESDTLPPPKGARDKRQKSNLLTHVPTCCSSDLPSNSSDHTIPYSTDESNSSLFESPYIASLDPLTGDVLGSTMIVSKEPRLIVEALIVRKLSLDEAFLDFEGFSLQ